MKRKLLLIITLSSFVFLSDDYKTEKQVIDLLENIVSEYQRNLSFSLLINNEQLKGEIDIEMAWLNDSSVFRKTKLDFIKGLDYSGVAWVWSMKKGKDKKWITKPSGKSIDVTKRKEFDFPVILPDQSMLDGYHSIADTLNYKSHKCAIVDVFKVSRGKKKGPLRKLWIDIEDGLIYKIEEFDYRKEVVTKETVMEYFDISDSMYKNLEAFPKMIYINDFKNNESSSMKISDYKIDQEFDLSIFEPANIK